MRFLCLLSLLFVLTAVAKKKTSTKSQKESDKGLSKISTLVTKLATSPVVPLSDSNFSKFVIDRPREYSAFLMFTATAKQYQCTVCVRAKTVFDEIAAHYQQQYDFNSTSIQNRIVFFSVEVDDARSTFQDMQLETVPRLYLLPATSIDSPKMKLTEFEIESKHLLESASAALAEIHTRTGIKVSSLLKVSS